MDGRKPLFPLHDPTAQPGIDAEPRAAAAFQREDLPVVYCGSARQLSEGFTVALRVMPRRELAARGPSHGRPENPAKENTDA
jgi:hypothetical protein